MARLVMAVDRADPVAGTDALLEVLDRPRGLDERALERDVGSLTARYGTGPTGSSTALFVDLMALVVRHGFGVPPQVAAAFRALAALEGTLRLLDPEMDLVEASRKVGEELFAGQLQPRELRAALEDQLLQVLPVLQRLPRRLDSLADAAQHGDLGMSVRVLAHPEERAFLTGVVSQLVMTLLAGGRRCAPSCSCSPTPGRWSLPGFACSPSSASRCSSSPSCWRRGRWPLSSGTPVPRCGARGLPQTAGDRAPGGMRGNGW